MMKFIPRICVAVLVLISTTALCHARTAWVSDMLVLSFRQGPGTGYPATSALKSDTPLTILDERNGYLKVELSSGKQGWVDKKYVVTDPPKSLIIDQLKKEKAALEEKVSELTQQAARGSSDTPNAQDQAVMEKLKKENHDLSQKLSNLTSRYAALKAAPGKAADLLEENKRLKAENQALSAKTTLPQSSDRFMPKPDMIKWFLAGVGVLLLGWGIGLSLSSRKGGSGSLLD